MGSSRGSLVNVEQTVEEVSTRYAWDVMVGFLRGQYNNKEAARAKFVLT